MTAPRRLTDARKAELRAASLANRAARRRSCPLCRGAGWRAVARMGDVADDDREPELDEQPCPCAAPPPAPAPRGRVHAREPLHGGALCGARGRDPATTTDGRAVTCARCRGRLETFRR